MDHDMGATKMKDMSNHHMWMWFHSTINDTVLFEFWTVKTVPQMILACAIISTMGFIYEFIKYQRWKYSVIIQQQEIHLNTNYVQRLFQSQHLVQTILFAIQIIVSYMLMLVFMTFSIWLGIAICVGVSCGYYIFGRREISMRSNRTLTQEIH